MCMFSSLTIKLLTSLSLGGVVYSWLLRVNSMLYCLCLDICTWTSYRGVELTPTWVNLKELGFSCFQGLFLNGERLFFWSKCSNILLTVLSVWQIAKMAQEAYDGMSLALVYVQRTFFIFIGLWHIYVIFFPLKYKWVVLKTSLSVAI